MGKRPTIPQTKSSTYRPMTQMNGDFLTQLRKPVCSEFNPDFRGSTRAREEHCRQKVLSWYKDQEYTLRKLNRREDELYDDLIHVEREKRKLHKLKKRSMSVDSLHSKASDAERNSITFPTLERTLDSAMAQMNVGADHASDTRELQTGFPAVASDRQQTDKEKGHIDVKQGHPVQIPEGALQRSLISPHKEPVNFLPSIDENGLIRDVNTDAIDIMTETNDLAGEQTDAFERARSVGFADHVSYEHDPDDELFDQAKSSDRYKKRRQSVGLIWINRNRGRETELKRKAILNNEKLQLYDRNEKGQVVPSYRQFKRKEFALPNAHEKRERQKRLKELEGKKGVESQQMQEFFVKVDEDKGRALQQYRARRQRSSDELVLKEKASVGMVSLERLATIFSHRNVNPLPENVDPESIEAMRQMTYVRGHTVEEEVLQRQKARNQTKHIFQQKVKIDI